MYAFLGQGGNLPAWNFSKYVIDKNGRIAGVFDSELRASHHVDGVRELVRKLS